MALLTYFKQLAFSGKLVLLITHNRTSLSFCDKIISLDEE
jgi:ABC-type transport system involved in cytochrome bd biosynthesis fused ATPase/permease subunit